MKGTGGLQSNRVWPARASPGPKATQGDCGCNVSNCSLEPLQGLLNEVPQGHQLLQELVQVIFIGACPSWGPWSLLKVVGGDCPAAIHAHKAQAGLWGLQQSQLQSMVQSSSAHGHNP